MQQQNGNGESRKRLFFTLLVPFLLLIGGGAAYVGKDRVRSEQDLIRKSEISNVIMGVRRLDGELSLPLRQLRALRESAAMRQTLAGAPNSVLETAFSDLILNTGIYDKIRWVDESGQEQVRVENVEGRPRVIAPAPGDNIADSYYFINAMKLKPGQAYVSPMDLNVEAGTVSQPHKPSLRLALRLLDATGQPRGLLILNVAARRMLDAFTESVAEARDHAMLLNSEGYWLKSVDGKEEWGFMLNRQDTLGSRNPEAWKAISAIPSGQEDLADGLWTWSTVYPLKSMESRDVADLPGWLVVAHLPRSQMDLVGASVWPQVLGSAALLGVLFAGICGWLARALSQRSQARVEAVKAHAEAAAAQRLNESLERFHLIVEANVNGILAVDSQGHIVLTNPALESMFGYEHDELLGKPMDILLPESLRAGHAGLRGGYMKSPAARPMGAGRVLAGRRKDGSEFPLEISLSPYTEHGEQYVDAIVVDLSRRDEH